MKLTRYLFVALVALGACSKDDPTPLEKKQLSIEEAVTIPSALSSSSNENAQELVGYMELANGMSALTGYFGAPSGAKKSSTPIIAANGRISGTTVTYTWNDDQYGSVAYQVTEESDSYLFEFLVKEQGSTEYLRFLAAYEKKDKSHGYIKYYNIYEGDPTELLAEYNWHRDGDMFYFDCNLLGIIIDMEVNTKTGDGKMDYFLEETKFYSFTWKKDGSGTWATYDDEGNVAETGSW